MKRNVFRYLVPVLLLFLIATVASPKKVDQLDLRVHEWGTFTSIAGENGAAISWQPFGGPTDLPCFVDRLRNFKTSILGTVRMETPVLYFYGPRESTANVKVFFPKGVITEWYPKAAAGSLNNVMEWRDVRISPDGRSDFPIERAQSHYYAARQTDSASLQVGPQKEKFLFYRGVGTFPLPISAKMLDRGRILVKNLGADAVSALIHFENRGGKFRYQLAGLVGSGITLDSESLHGNLPALEADLDNILVEHGLYKKEAQAMIATWRDSWFEEGSRLIYIVPRSVVDSILPLEIQPNPVQIVRVFVGRMEIITPAILEDVKQAIANHDQPSLEKYSRFLEPIAKRIGARSPLLAAVYTSYLSRASACSR